MRSPPQLNVMCCKHLLLLPKAKILGSILTYDRLWLTAALMGDISCIGLLQQHRSLVVHHTICKTDI